MDDHSELIWASVVVLVALIIAGALLLSAHGAQGAHFREVANCAHYAVKNQIACLKTVGR